MPNNKYNMIGQKFGRLTVINELKERTKYGDKIYKCLCDCGNYVIAVGTILRRGSKKSCGCLNHEPKYKTHGKHNTRLFKTLNRMKQRCYNKNTPNYKNYGGRGIVVCDEWLNNFMKFYNWAINNGYDDNLTIDRIDVDGNYEPNNCRWITNLEQQNNKRNNVLLTYKGKTQTMAQWCKELNINYNTLSGRHYRGYTDKECLFGRDDHAN